MAAGLKSASFDTLLPSYSNTSYHIDSRHLAFLRSRRGILDDYPFLRTLVKLATSPRRWVNLPAPFPPPPTSPSPSSSPN